MVNIRLAAIGKRAQLKFPAARASARRRKPRNAATSISAMRRKPVPCPVYQRDDLGAGARIAGPALIEEHGTTTVLFKGDRCTGRALRRTDHRRRRRVMAKARKQALLRANEKAAAPQGARRGHARSHPQRAAGHRQRDGRRPAAHLLQHDDLRGARFLHRAGQPQGRADLAERRRRVAFRRRSRRHHHRRP